MKLTNEQMRQAMKMYESGITWSIIATFFKVDTVTLRKQRKNYEQQQTN
jgi:hypothetical protein